MSFLENKGKGNGFVINEEFVAEDDDETYAFEHEEDTEESRFDDNFTRRPRGDGEQKPMIAEPTVRPKRTAMVEELRRSADVDRLAPHADQINQSCPEIIQVLFPKFAKINDDQDVIGIYHQKRKRSVDVNLRPAQKRRIGHPITGWYGCPECGNVWPERSIKASRAADCHCTDPLDDTLAACWVGSPNHKHRRFLFQSSSPFWANRPDP